VGKTTVSVNLAFAFAESGFKVGIMDADLHGPNVALMTGIEGIPALGDGEQIKPVVASLGVKVLSIASFLPDADSPIVWRGPRKAAAIRQFLGLGDWSGLDVLIVDCPPGTGDEPMSVAQLIPSADGVVIVTSPQDVSLLDCRKCISFIREIDHRVLGIVENFSGYTCPECGTHVDLMKSGGGERAAEELRVPFLGRIPITLPMVEAGDSGRPLVKSAPDDPAAFALIAIARTISNGWDNEPAAAEAEQDSSPSDEPTPHKTVAVAAEDDGGLDGHVSAHFGRCPYYVLAEVNGTEVIETRIQANPHFESHRPGILPQYIHGLGADVILAGGMGPKAVDLFHSFGIEVATGALGKVGGALDSYLRGDLQGIVPCAHDHPDSCGKH
jgi:Mrp family chromosome partitioning ATPase/predicted Fe-Mo cluster-binding NifX family protein